MQNLVGNLRYAVRQFRLSPVFTAAAVLTLALGIGGTTAIFTLIDAVMLRSLPVSDPGRLYRVGEGDDCCVEGGPQDRWGMFSFPLYERLRAEAPVRGGGCFPGRPRALERTARGRCIGCPTSALRIRHRKLLLNPWGCRLWREGIYSE